MTKAITKPRVASKKSSKDSHLGLSMVRLSGFRICQLIKEGSPNTLASETRALRELLYSKEAK